MALSEREQQVLRDLESQLHQEDPGLADTLEHEESGPLRLSPRRIGAGVALVLVGMSLVLGGVVVRNSLFSVVLGVVGFGLAVWGITVALTRVRAAAGGTARSGSARPRSRPSFMDRQSQRWDRRRDSRE